MGSGSGGKGRVSSACQSRHSVIAGMAAVAPVGVNYNKMVQQFGRSASRMYGIRTAEDTAMDPVVSVRALPMYGHSNVYFWAWFCLYMGI